jgi:hypothetical protein
MSSTSKKAGWKTTEFWVTLGTSAWAIFGHSLPAAAQAVVVAVATAGYAISRAIVKVGGERS